MTAKYKTIAVADENEENLIIAKNLLDGSCNVMTVTSGKTLFLLLESVKPDLIMLNIFLPDMNVRETIDTLQGAERLTGIPVIFFYGNIDPKSDEKGLCIGIDSCLIKPFSTAMLTEWLKMHLYD